MFEYLMPLLVMPTYENTLLDQTYKAAVARQIEYGKKRGCHGAFQNRATTRSTFISTTSTSLWRARPGTQTRARRGSGHRPLCLGIGTHGRARGSVRNLEALASRGFQGKYGFYEAIDYTPTHLPRGHSNAVVRSFMAHHQGMSFLSLAYLMLDRPMQKRFESDPAFQATLLLLQERPPKATAFYSHAAGISEAHTALHPAEEMPVRVYATPDTPVPEVQLLSNGRYHVMITNAGGGYSRWKDMAVTRWREDSTCDNWGTFCYVRDVASGVLVDDLSTGHSTVQRSIRRNFRRAGGVPLS